MKKDDIKVKESDRLRKLKKKKVEEADDNLGMGDDFFDESLPMEPAQSFHEMNLSRPLMKAIASMNFVHPTPIQAATIPVGLLGRDICGCAATGTGTINCQGLIKVGGNLKNLTRQDCSFHATCHGKIALQTQVNCNNSCFSFGANSRIRSSSKNTTFICL